MSKRRENLVTCNSDEVKRLQDDIHKMTETIFAANCGIDVRTLVKMRNGSPVRLSSVRSVANYCGVPLKHLLDDPETPVSYVPGKYDQEGDVSQIDDDSIIAFVEALSKRTRGKKKIYVICITDSDSVTVELQLDVLDAVDIARQFPMIARDFSAVRPESFSFAGLTPENSRKCAEKAKPILSDRMRRFLEYIPSVISDRIFGWLIERASHRPFPEDLIALAEEIRWTTEATDHLRGAAADDRISTAFLNSETERLKQKLVEIERLEQLIAELQQQHAIPADRADK